MDIVKAFEPELSVFAENFSRVLERLFLEREAQGDIPEYLMQAMRHGVMAGGKRLRPFLVAHHTKKLGGNPESAQRVGIAVELVHSYSLIHDDLPAMDNDLERRGHPTVHAAFGEATAILAGDALLAWAFEILAQKHTHPDPEVRMQLVEELARASGPSGLAGGQQLDLALIGKAGPRPKKMDETHQTRIDGMKTAALFRYAYKSAALIAGADTAKSRQMEIDGYTFGLEFQKADDEEDKTWIANQNL